MLILHNLFGRQTRKMYFPLIYEAPTHQNQTSQENYRPEFLKNIGAKHLNKISVNQT